MSSIPLSDKPWPSLLSPLWFSFDSAEEDKELWLLEQEVAAELDRVETKYCETTPLGKSGNESYVDEDEEEEEDDNDDEESESNDDDDDEEVDMEVEDHDLRIAVESL